MDSRLQAFREMKVRGEKIAMLTAYDYPTARLLEEAGVDLLLVGDSVGMVVLGYPDTTHTTLQDIIHHTRAVARGARDTVIVADLPIATYDTPEAAVANARELIAAGAHAVKLEGGANHAAQVEALTASGIAAMGHIGMLPQQVLVEGGYRVKGKTPVDADRLYADAVALEKAGVFAIVLELVKPDVAGEISRRVSVPSIGIGSGCECDGQVLVIHDLAGLFPWFTPKFATPKANAGKEIREAAAAYIRETKGLA